jgi:lipopolysaccharide exporter
MSTLAKRTVVGAIWTTLSSIGSRMIGIVTTFILTRLLPPDVQGEVYNTYIVVGSASALTTLGLGQYITAHPKAGRGVAFHVSVYFTLAGLVACLVCWLLRDHFAVAFNLPTLATFLPGFILSITLDRLGTLPRNILARDMRFRTLGFRQAMGEVVFGAVTILTAWLGWGGQSIVVGNIARGFIGFVFLATVVDRREWLEPCRLSMETTKRLFRFGLPFSIGTFFHYGAGNWDNITMGRIYGDATVGLYNQAYKLADLPATHIGEQIGDVLVPSFAHMDEVAERRSALSRASGILCLVVFPLAIGLGAVSATLVAAFYTADWQGVAPLLTVLSALSVVRPI